ncbi:MAG: AMP-binding protein [Candidatus Omnitrophota bacterium]
MTTEKYFTLHEKLRQIYEDFPDVTVIQAKTEEGYRKYTYKEFFQTAQAIAAGLLRLGVVKGDRVAIVLDNCPEWGMIYFGVMLAGAVAVPLDCQSTRKDIQFYLSDSRSKVVFTGHKLFSLFEGLPERIYDLQKIILLPDETMFLPIAESEYISMYEQILSSEKGSVFPEVSVEDLASILYTSGTTGNPKGVMLTHRNFYANYRSIEQMKLVSEKDNVISILPLHHSFPFTVSLIIPLFSRSRITYISSLKNEELLGCMRDTQVTVFPGVPQLLYLFYQKISKKFDSLPIFARILVFGIMEVFWTVRKKYGINPAKLIFRKVHRPFGKQFRFFACGGAKLNEEAARFLIKIGFTVLEGYGLTETSPIVTINSLREQKIGSPGKAVPQVELKIVSPDENGVGQVAIKGPNVMKGYYNREKETQEVLQGEWFYSGDLGYVDKKGYLRLTGREKELIILSSGKNISPEEVETYYSGTAYIKELCVLSMGDNEEEKLMAVVVPDFDYYRSIGEVNVYARVKFALENLSKVYAPYKRIMGFVVTSEELPRTRLGKLKRFEIKEKYINELSGAGTRDPEGRNVQDEADLKIMSSNIGKKILSVLKKNVKISREIYLEDNLEIDLGIDSLGRVEHLAELEKDLNIDIPDTVMEGVFTVRELVLAIEKVILEKEIHGERKTAKKTESNLWCDILRSDPAEDVTSKIVLSPGLVSEAVGLGICNMLKIIFSVFWKFRVTGVNNLPPEEAFILCPNHASYLDGFLIICAVPGWLRKKLFFLGLRAYFEIKFLRGLVKLIKVIPIDPVVHMIDAMRACAYILRNQQTVCIFPEGGRSIDGEIKEFKKGIGILAKELNIRLIPVGLKGSYEAWPRTKKFPRLYPVEVIFGAPCDKEELRKQGRQLGAKDDYEAIAVAIREKVSKLKEGS